MYKATELNAEDLIPSSKYDMISIDCEGKFHEWFETIRKAKIVHCESSIFVQAF